jgi:hypothetical protein
VVPFVDVAGGELVRAGKSIPSSCFPRARSAGPYTPSAVVPMSSCASRTISLGLDFVPSELERPPLIAAVTYSSRACAAWIGVRPELAGPELALGELGVMVGELGSGPSNTGPVGALTGPELDVFEP